MGWSTIDSKKAWAYAHDWEQVLFMSLAPEVLDRSASCKELGWLKEWKEYWVEHKESYANGCSDIDLGRFLTSEERINEFFAFLGEYDDYVRCFGSSIPAEEMNERIKLRGMRLLKPCEVGELLDFTEKIRAVVGNDLSHAKVERKENT